MSANAPARFEPVQAIEINKFPKDKYNVLIPGDMTTQLTPFLRPIARQVEIDPDPDHGDVYPITQRKQGEDWVATELGLSAVALNKLASVAGMLDIPQASGRVDDGRDPDVVTHRATMAIRLPDGEWRVLTRECTIKLSTLEKEVQTQKRARADQYKWSDSKLAAEIRKEMLLHEKFMERKAETGAKNRVVRAALSLRSKYTPKELERPFVIAAVVPDANQPELRERLLDQASSASAALFGPGQARVGAAPRQLTGGPPVEVVEEATAEAEGGELTADELGAVAVEAEQQTLDQATGEVVEDPDWSKPASGPTPGEQFVIVLQERAEASEAKGPATDAQRTRLKAALRGLGTPTTMAVLRAAWKLEQPGAISAAQADAILDHAEGRKDFQDLWKAAAAELAAAEASA
jgi:hypothetical protein